ncbi:hypothetical protein POKO110462_22445 [Pontibacter korlensis]
MLVLASCSDNEFIYYEYKGVTVTRQDGNGESYFYYGRCDDNENPCPEDYIKAEYYGFDGVMHAYLVFQEDKRVKLVRVADNYEKKGKDSSLYLFDYRAGYKLSTWLDSIEGNYDNVAQVYYARDVEKTTNAENFSRVNASYPIQN